MVVCHSILEDQGVQKAPAGPHPTHNRPSHCLMCHPMAHALLVKVEEWVQTESQNENAEALLAAVRGMARSMMGLDAL